MISVCSAVRATLEQTKDTRPSYNAISKSPPKPTQKRKLTYEVPKKLQVDYQPLYHYITVTIQAVTPDSIFTIEAAFSTFGTRRKTKRMLDLCGPIDDDDSQIQIAIRASLEDSNRLPSPTKISRKAGGSKMSENRRNVRPRRSRNSQMQQMGEVLS